MTKLLFFFAFFMTINSGYSQKSIQIKDQYLEIRAVQNGEAIKMEITDFVISIDYETGEFLAKVDFENPNLFQNEIENRDRIPGGEIVEINGNIPIREILDDQSSNLSMTYELTISYTGNEEIILFDFNMMDIPTSPNNAKIFQSQGTMDLNDFEIEDLNGFDSEVLLYLEFHTYMIGG